MALRLEELAKTIDHTLNEPDPAPPAVLALCDEAREHHLAAVCVGPKCVRLAVERVRGWDVKVSGLVAAGARKETAALAARCVAAGAAEIDVELDGEAMLAGAFRPARDDLAAVVRSVRMAGVNTGRGSALVKVCIGCDRLDDGRKRLACLIVEDVDADFAVMKAGLFGTAALHDLELLRDRLPERIGVKASVPVARFEEAQELIAAGAARIGTPHAAAVLSGQAVLSGAARA